jgi:hypothetical protein
MAKTRTRPQPSKRPSARKKSSSRKRAPQPWYRKHPWLPWAASLIVATAVVIAFQSRGSEGPPPGVSVSNPVVGADLHSLVVDPNEPETLYIGSHQGVSISTDGGESWEVVESLNGADAMGWAFTEDLILVGGHPGLMASTDGGNTFEQRNEGLPSTDVHALGAGDDVIYAGLAGVGTFASTDDGRSWVQRSKEFGGQFMGRIHVDPADDDHLLAPDMAAGAVESNDGGRTWARRGGVPGAMWVSWDVDDTEHMIATGQGLATESVDGGENWKPLDIPEGASIVEFSPKNADVVFAAVLEAPEASVYVSRDGGETWNRP